MRKEAEVSKGAKILFVEDYEPFRSAIKLLIHSDSEHRVVLEAGSLKEALQKVKEAKNLGVDLAICDSDLGGGWDQGAVVAEALRKEVPGIKIVCYSGALKLPEWGDANVEKGGRSPYYLLNVIRHLMQQTEEER